MYYFISTIHYSIWIIWKFNIIILKISYVYIDKNNDIVKLKNDKIVLNEYNVLSKEEYNGSLSLYGYPITCLGNLRKINGYLNLYNTQIKELPDNLEVDAKPPYKALLAEIVVYPLFAKSFWRWVASAYPMLPFESS